MRLSCRVFTVLAATALLGGCAATVKRSGDEAPIKVGANATKAIVLSIKGEPDATSSKDWEPFKGVWKAAMEEEAQAVGATVTSVDADAKATGKPGTLLAVDIIDFRYISTGARIGLGVMTGNAFVNAQVTFKDLENGQVWGERHYDTKSSAWQGVFSPMTDKQVHAICKEIVTTLSSH
ncbi:MAG TPA: hypothetical protein VGI23_21325 [Steroidobacteraceae bacterium]